MSDESAGEHRAGADGQPRTWWERNAISVMATFSLVMLIFVIVFQMSC